MKKIAIVLAAASLASAVQAQTVINPPATYPYVISQPGSYKLGGNFVAPSTSSPPGVDAVILIDAPNVTLDLNGYRVAGSTTCSYAANTVSCVGGATAPLVGIQVDYSNPGIRIHGGSVSGIGTHGIDCPVEFCVVEDMRVSHVGGNGIGVSNSGVVRDVSVYLTGGNGNTSAVRTGTGSSLARISVLYANQGVDTFASTLEDIVVGYSRYAGIDAGNGSSIDGCTVYQSGLIGAALNVDSTSVKNCALRNNLGTGLDAGGTSVVTNVVSYANQGVGADLSTDTGYSYLNLSGNTGGQLSGSGTALGTSLCNGVSC